MHSYLQGHPALILAVRKLESLNPDKFELYFTRKSSTRIESKNLEIDSLTRAEDVGMAVRFLKDRRLGFSFTTSLDEPSIERAVDSAAEIAAVMPEDDLNDLFSFSSAVYPSVDTVDPRGLAAPLHQKLQLAQDLESLCRKADRRITGVRSANVSETAIEIHMVDSTGEHIQHQSTLYTASITCKAEQGGDSQIGSELSFSNELENLDIAGTGQRAARWATELLGAGQAPTMKCPAILRNSVVAELVEFLASSFSAEEIDKGRSMLAGRHGDRVFSEKVTLINDGLLAGGMATQPFDGEGVPCARTVLVDGGFFSGALYDTYYARKKGVAPTGSASRGLKSPPTISPANLFLEKGRHAPEQLMEGISKGILITDLMGVHTANPVTGDFSLGASGILIENGKLTRPVRGFAVAGNLLDLFQRMTDISNDLRFFGSIGAPSVRVGEISVGGA